MRAPGGYIPDKMDFSYDVDVYQIWAESLVFGENRSFAGYAFRRYVTHVGRGENVSYLHSAEEIRERYRDKILAENEPPKSIAGGMGSHVFLLKAASTEELMEQASFILKKKE